MKNIIISFLTGLAGALFAMYSVGNSFANVDRQDVEEAIQAGQCQVYVGYGHMTVGSRCFSNEVMTGYWNDNVYCAEISVNCF